MGNSSSKADRESVGGVSGGLSGEGGAEASAAASALGGASGTFSIVDLSVSATTMYVRHTHAGVNDHVGDVVCMGGGGLLGPVYAGFA